MNDYLQPDSSLLCLNLLSRVTLRHVSFMSCVQEGSDRETGDGRVCSLSTGFDSDIRYTRYDH